MKKLNHLNSVGATTNVLQTVGRRRPAASNLRRKAYAEHALCVMVLSCFAGASVLGEVVRFEISERDPFAGGKSFGSSGPYERIVGRAFFAIDPQAPENAAIVDLEHAPRNASKRVEFAADLFVLAPVDLARGNGTALYAVNNRGNKLALRFFNDAPGSNTPGRREHAGNGFLFRSGFTIVWSGWDGELLPLDGRLQLTAPIANPRLSTEAESLIVGPVRYEIVPEKEGAREPVNGRGHGAYRPTLGGVERATLTWRQRPSDPRIPIPRDQFHLHVTDSAPPRPGQLPQVELELPVGFRPGNIYELCYEAQNPLVHGVAFASVRDLMTALKNGEGQGNPFGGNPGSTGSARPVAIPRAYGFGVSQSGRFLREFLHAGFNQDERGRKVFDAVLTHVAGGGLGSFNHRFAQPTAYGTQYAQHDTPSDRFPFAYETQDDPFGQSRADGILRGVRPEHQPVLFHTQSSTEYWTRGGSLPHTDPLGRRDASVPENVRFYTFGGTQHGPSSYPPTRGIGQNLSNPADYRPLLRALLLALDAWARDGTPPPPSVYPTIRAGTLVDFEQTSTGFPAIPGVRYPAVIHAPSVLDFGPRWTSHSIIDRQPPGAVGPHYRVLVPRTDADGNPLGCLLPPEVAVPLATFTGWNLRRRDAGAQDQLVGLHGSYLPFPRSRAEREELGDPRPSLKERYSSIDAYTEKLKRACNELVRDRYLLEDDVRSILNRQTARLKTLLKARTQ